MAAKRFGTPGATCGSGTALSCTCLYAVASAVSATNGGRPATISYSTIPSEYMSLRGSAASPLACSGEKYVAVPITEPSCVRPSSWPASIARAMPKSATLATPSSVMRMFAGFTSRWTTPLRCAKASASATWAPMRAATSARREP